MKDANRIGTTLSEWVAQGDWRLFFLHRDRLAKVTADDVTRVAGKYLQRSNRTVGLYMPTAKVGADADPRDAGRGRPGQGLQGRQRRRRRRGVRPDAGEHREARAALGAAGGVKVALLPKKSRGEAVVVQHDAALRQRRSLKGQVTAADFLGSLMKRGTQQAHLPAASGRAGPEQDQPLRQQQRRRADRQRPVQALDAAEGAGAAPRGAARADLPEGRVRRSSSGSSSPSCARARPSRRSLAQLALRRKLSPYPADDVRYVPTIEESIAPTGEADGRGRAQAVRAAGRRDGRRGGDRRRLRRRARRPRRSATC